MSATDGEPRDENPEGGARYVIFSRGRVIFFLIMLIIEMAIFFAATIIPVDPATQQDLTQTANNVRNATAGASPLTTMRFIFSNNLRVALFELVPVFGPLVFATSIFTTGQLLQVVALAAGYPSVQIGLLLFAFPYTIVELSAYALAVVSGSMLVVAWRRRSLGREVRIFALEAVAVVTILFVAAAMETATLQSFTLGFALWLPTALFLVWLALNRRRISG